ncbi:MAG: 3-deoxy-manno-octulosonate-8-phosphatase KdsC [Gammaproteobacteria bacterium]|nr:3-deoxy-manno-octulosonate-8-phosphatase KdsC [Gammaproteobacteria bacterium]
MQDILERAAKIELVIFDVDGVLTDGRLYVTDSGEEIKAFHSRDGHGLKMLQQSGVTVGIITGRTSNIVTHRMSELGVEHVFQGQRDKIPAFEKMIANLSLQPEQVAYVGDDVVDLPVMRRVGLAIAVQDAHPFVKQHAHWQTPNCGGRGAARDVCELLIEAHGKLETMLAEYL